MMTISATKDFSSDHGLNGILDCLNNIKNKVQSCHVRVNLLAVKPQETGVF